MSRSQRSRRIEDVPEELIHHIQSRLPLKEAARTSVLSKSWRHAWSTIPTLRFRIRRKEMKLADMEHTLIRYLRDNIPIERLDLDIEIEKGVSASSVETCIRTSVASKTRTLKELSISLYPYGDSFNLPHEILSCENLAKISVISAPGAQFFPLQMTSHHPVVTIKCVSLRELYLKCVDISQELLDGILSSCRLLEKVELIQCSRGINTIKVKNLPCLRELSIVTQHGGSSTALDINQVPNLRLFICNLHAQGQNPRVPFNAHSISLGSSLMELSLIGVVTDDASLDKIKSGVPFLQSLTLDMTYWKLENFHFTCASIKRLSLQSCRRSLIDVEVYAPNLLFFRFDGNSMPSLLFPVSTLIEQTKFELILRLPVDASFFLKMREALALSSNCDVHLTLKLGTSYQEPPPWDINIDDLRTSLPFPPAMKVQHLLVRLCRNECEHTPFFDAFFEICHPNHVTANPDIGFPPGNYFCKVMLREVLENKMKTTTAFWPRYLKRLQIRRHQNWETLTNIHRRFLVGPTPARVYFKLEWR